MGKGHSGDGPARDDAAVAAERPSPSLPARVLIIDDHAIVREGLSKLIDLEPDLQVVGGAGTIADGLAAAASLRPDVIISDISFPGATGVQGIVELRHRIPQARLLVLTVHNSEEYIRAALCAGADGYVLKDSTRAELIRGVRAVLARQRYLCPRSSARVMRGYLGEEPPSRRLVSGISGREREVLCMIAGGRSNKQIAQALEISIKTVEKHRASLMRKLALHNVAEVTRFALQSGILQVDQDTGEVRDELTG